MTLALIHSPFQLGYVTNDLDQAIKRFTAGFGVGEFVYLPVDHPNAARIAIAYTGDMMVEVIEPPADADDLYSRWLADAVGFTLRLHHLGMLAQSREELVQVRARHAALGHQIASEGDSPGFVAFLYADTTSELGHYLEYVCPDEGVQALFKSVPGSTFGSEDISQ